MKKYADTIQRLLSEPIPVIEEVENEIEDFHHLFCCRLLEDGWSASTVKDLGTLFRKQYPNNRISFPEMMSLNRCVRGLDKSIEGKLETLSPTDRRRPFFTRISDAELKEVEEYLDSTFPNGIEMKIPSNQEIENWFE